MTYLISGYYKGSDQAWAVEVPASSVEQAISRIPAIKSHRDPEDMMVVGIVRVSNGITINAMDDFCVTSVAYRLRSVTNEDK